MIPSSALYYSPAWLLVQAVLVSKGAASNLFAACEIKAKELANGTIPGNENFIYRGPFRGFTGLEKDKPLALTYEGCRALCGSGSDLNDVFTAFQILTTWVLPAVALFSNLPYESLSLKKYKNIEAFVNWVGSPASALTSTIYNIWLIKKCHEKAISMRKEIQIYSLDAYFVLTCINQYEYPGSGLGKLSRPHEIERDQALFYGIFRPLHSRSNNDAIPPDVVQTRQLLVNLAYQLRLQRRRGVWPLAINVIWFLVAFVISVVSAFADLGDNSTAHSLALGLLLSWLPILVVMSSVDRNPVAATRCQVLIERWLYNVHNILVTPGHIDAYMWRPGEVTPHIIGEFVGQGRRLRYCGVTRTMLLFEKLQQPAENLYFVQGKPDNVDMFRREIVKRSKSWWVIWLISQVIVTLNVGMAFMVSFQTPTVGLGCRSLLYLIFYLFSILSWITLGFWQEPPRMLQITLLIFNGCAAVLLVLIMGFQVTNGLNNCMCKSSIYGLKDYGGYIDFKNAVFYRNHYDVEKYWAVATGFGLASCVLVIWWALRRWNRASSLWKVNEKHSPDQGGAAELDWLV